MESTTVETFVDETAVRERLEAAGLGDICSDEVSCVLESGTLVKLAERLRSTAEPKIVAGVLAQAVQRPAAVWWACRAARLEHGGGLAEAEAAGVEAAEFWLRAPEQWKAYAANEASKKVGLACPAGCAALAAFFAGESIGPSHLDALPPGAHLAGMVAASAVELAATRRPSEDVGGHWEALLDMGFAIAAGTDDWRQPPTADI